MDVAGKPVKLTDNTVRFYGNKWFYYVDITESETGNFVPQDRNGEAVVITPGMVEYMYNKLQERCR